MDGRRAADGRQAATGDVRMAGGLEIVKIRPGKTQYQEPYRPYPKPYPKLYRPYPEPYLIFGALIHTKWPKE